MSVYGLDSDFAKNGHATYFASVATHLTLLRGLTLAGATAVGAATFQVDLSVVAGDKIVFDKGAVSEEMVVVQSVSGAGPYTVTPTTPLIRAHVLSGPNLGVQSHIPCGSGLSVHEVVGVTRVAHVWSSASNGVVTSSVTPTVPVSQKVGSQACMTALTGGSYVSGGAVPGFTNGGSVSSFPVTWQETFT